MKRTGSPNPNYEKLISELKKLSIQENVRIWKRIASDLEKPSRKHRIVNLSKLNNHAKENELVVVPGKVLGGGELDHKIAVAAYQFSSSAKEKIAKKNSLFMTLKELMEKNPKGKNMRIIG